MPLGHWGVWGYSNPMPSLLPCICDGARVGCRLGHFHHGRNLYKKRRGMYLYQRTGWNASVPRVDMRFVLDSRGQVIYNHQVGRV